MVGCFAYVGSEMRKGAGSGLLVADLGAGLRVDLMMRLTSWVG